MLNKMDKFDIFVPHPPVITSLLPLEYGCKPLVCLLKRHALLSLDFQDHSVRNYSCYTFGEGAVKWPVKKKKGSKRKRVVTIWHASEPFGANSIPLFLCAQRTVIHSLQTKIQFPFLSPLFGHHQNAVNQNKFCSLLPWNCPTNVHFPVPILNLVL